MSIMPTDFRRSTAVATTVRLAVIATVIVLGRSSLVVAQAGQTTTVPAASQNPSPMVEETRSHQRLTQRSLGGVQRSFVGPEGKPVELWLPESARTRADIDLVVHFH